MSTRYIAAEFDLRTSVVVISPAGVHHSSAVRKMVPSFFGKHYIDQFSQVNIVIIALDPDSAATLAILLDDTILAIGVHDAITIGV